MNEAGLPEKWRLQIEKGGNRCVGYDTKGGRNANKKCDQRITLQNMSGPFLVLLVGMFSSLVVFIIELIIPRRESATVADNPPPVSGDPIKEAEASAGSNPSNVSINNKPSEDQLNNDETQPPVVVHQSDDIVVDNRPKVTTTNDAAHVVMVTNEISVAPIENRPDNSIINEPDNESSSDYVINTTDDHRQPVKGEAGESHQIVIINSLPSNDDL